MKKLTPKLMTYFAATLLFFSCAAHAAFFVTTGQTGAQVQVDVNHTQYWTITPEISVAIDGARFDMKKGPNSSQDVYFSLIQGTINDWNSGTYQLIKQSILTKNDFSQQFNYKDFLFDSPTTLATNLAYTGILWSRADNGQTNPNDRQNSAYFVKDSFSVVDAGSNQTSSQTTSQNTSNAVPEPPTLTLWIVGLLSINLYRSRSYKAVKP